MSFVLAVPEALATAASDVAGIGSTLGAASAAAAGPTTGVLAAAGDEVSAQIAALFSEHGLGYQQLSARVAAFHEQFVQALTAGTNAYSAAEANIAQTLANAVSARRGGRQGRDRRRPVQRREPGRERPVGNGGLGTAGPRRPGGRRRRQALLLLSPPAASAPSRRPPRCFHPPPRRPPPP